jgi:thiol-disulfide isomerase/thioredoxin
VKVTALANKNWVSFSAPLFVLFITTLLTMLLLSTNAQAFTDLEGKPDSINNHIGKDKWTIVEVWSSDCQACRMHMPEMVEFDGKLKNARLLGVTLDGQAGIEDAEDFLLEYGVKFPTIVTNPIEMSIWMEQSIGESLRGTPTFILFDPEGKLVAAQPGIVAVTSLEKFITSNSKSAVTVEEEVSSKS